MKGAEEGMNTIDNIPDNMRIYIQEIAEKMAQGRAAVMIGSGFSKNAREYRCTEKKFLDWNQLGDIFYKKLYGKLPEEEEHPCYYQSILKLASKVQQNFGRSNLDKLLLDNLPDEEYEPSELHESLLKLNWTDIFTTNYDTLLERTRARVFNKRYQVVLNKDDLVYSKYPRIIKLHGSFPSSRPFIITEEDYRRYPQDFAVFVNTVRQSLIENVMCMIGFSGDDPNFLSWIGWIRDHLGNESASKIYLIGVFDIDKTEQMLYDSRNIILINMKDCEGINSGDHKKGLSLFFYALEHFQRIEEKEESIQDNQNQICQLLTSYKSEKIKLLDNTEILQNFIDTWRKERENYSEWFIIPYSKREKIEKNIELESIFIKTLGDIMKSQKELEKKKIKMVGEILYELNWRREQCLLPVGEGEADVYAIYLSKLPDTIGRWGKKDCEICFTLLEYWRLHGNFKEWNAIIIKLEEQIDDTQKNKLFYEKAAKMFYNLECSDLSNALMDLSGAEYRVGLEFKISSLLVELGYYEKAILLLKKCLYDARKQMGNDISYRYYSKEAYLIYLLENMEKHYAHLKYQDKTNDDDNHSYLNMLKGYDCNPEYEMDFLICQNIICKYTKSGDVQYDLVKEANTEKYIIFMEKTGMIFRASYLFKHAEEFSVLLKGLVYQNPYLALICCLRFGDSAICRQVWQNGMPNSMEKKVADELITWCIDACKKNEGYLIFGSGKDDNIAIMLPDLIPIILSGLVKRGSYEKNIEVYNFIIYILQESKLKFSFVNELIKALVMRFIDFGKKDLLNQLAKLPVGCTLKYDEEGIVDPFLHLDLAMKGLDKPNCEIMNKLKIYIESSDQSKMEAAGIRLLVIAILCEMEDMSFIDNIKNKVEKKSYELFNLIECYDIKYGDKEKQRQVKERWLEQLEKQVIMFDEKDITYCSDFRKELGELLKKEKFYHRVCPQFEWDREEVTRVIDLLEKWADIIIRFKQNLCIEVSYYDGWCLLEEILMDIVLLNKISSINKTCIKLSGLTGKLERLEIPFLFGMMIVQDTTKISKEVCHLFIKALLKGGYSREEAEKILRFYKENNLVVNEEFLEIQDLI